MPSPKVTTLKAQSQQYDAETRLDKIIEIREILERGYATTAEIARQFNISNPTAAEWRKRALQLIGKDNNGFTREGIRNLQIGRIMAKIERLEHMLNQKLAPDLELKTHDRIKAYYDSLARITGLNVETTLNVHQQLKPLTIVRATDTNDSAKSHNVIDSVVTPDNTPTHNRLNHLG